MIPNMILLDMNPSMDNIDMYGIIIAIVGYIVVFSSLIALYFVFNKLPLLLQLKIRVNLRRQGKECAEVEDLSVPGEVNAAISTALFMYFNEIHDEESNIITINKVSKSYSPWSSKIYGLRNFQKK